MSGLDTQALLAAGGCVHTLNPFQACDTCQRPPIGGRHDKVIAYGFVAETMDGTIITKSDRPSVSHLPLETVRKLVVFTDNPRIPRITLVVEPDRGERLFRFQRHALRIGLHAGQDGSSTTVEVLEVRHLDTGRALRLYLHPVEGPILSTQDLYF